MINSIKKIRTVNKEFSFKDLSALTDYAEGYFTDGDKLVASPSVKETGTLKNGLRCVRIYDIGFTVYYCSDGKLYRKVNGEFKEYGIPALSTPPEVFSVIYDGKKTAAAVLGSGAYLLNDRISFVSMVKGNAYAVFKGTLFIAKGRKIIVCGDAEYSGEQITVNPSTFLYPEGRYGAVIKFVEISGEFFAVCQRGAVKIALTGDDMEYSVEDCALPPFKSVPESIVSMGNEAYFININGLCRFNGRRVEKINSFFDKKIIEPCGEATAKDNYYLIPVNVGGQRKIYCMDCLSGKDAFIDGSGIIVAGENTASYITDKTGEIGVYNSERIWKSVKTDFGARGKKTVSCIYIESDYDVNVKIDGDGVVRNFTVKAGEGETPLSMSAEKFAFTLSDGVGNPLNVISGLSVKYRL